MSCFLLSGFEPFSTFTINPTVQIVKELDGEVLSDGTVIQSVLLPVVHQQSAQQLLDLIAKHEPIAVLSFGQATRASISLERVAINIDDFSLEDNSGNQLIDTVIVPDGPTAYWSTLPIKRMQKRLQQEGIPAAISNTAGTFVCNHIFYHLQHALFGRDIPSGFVHVPLLPEQALSGREPSLAKVELLKAVRLMVDEVMLWINE